MIDDWQLFALKLAITAVVVIAAAVIVDRTGPILGALVATLPLSAGPAYYFMALEHDRDFLAASSLSSLWVNPATIAFAALYANTVGSLGPRISLTLGLVMWLLVAAVVRQWEMGLAPAIAVNLLTFAAAMMATRHLRQDRAAPAARRAAAIEWVLRGLMVTFLVAAALLAARSLGAGTAGIIAAFPVVMTSLILVVQPRLGTEVIRAVLANGLPGVFGFSLGLCVLHFAIAAWLAGPALALALATCIAWNIAAGRWLFRQR